MEGTLVLTDKGYIAIERISPRVHSVMTHTGLFRRVTHHLSSVSKGCLVYIYTEHGDRPFACPGEHMLYVRTERNPTPLWLAAQDLQRGVHYVGLPLTTCYTHYGDDCGDDASPYAKALEEQRHLAHMGHPQGIYEEVCSGGECARGDVVIDDSYCWFRVVDVECTNEPSFEVHTLAVDIDRSYILQNMAVMC